MQAAHEPLSGCRSDFCLIRALGRHEISRPKRGAFRGDDRVPGKLVEERDDPAPKRLDPGECVNLTTTINRYQCLPLTGSRSRWSMCQEPTF